MVRATHPPDRALISSSEAERFVKPIQSAAALLALFVGHLVPAGVAAQSRRLVEDFRILPAESDSLAFSAIADIESGRGGRVYVLQPDLRVVQVFDSSGKRVRVIGRRGSGPGEFQFPLRLGLKQDSLWVWDPTSARISVFDEGGRLQRTISLGTVGSARLLASGEVAIKRYDEDAVRDGGVARLRAPLLRYSAGGAIVDTLLHLDADSVGPLRIPVAAGMAQGQQPFTTTPLWAVSPSGTSLVLVERNLASRPGDAIYRIRRVSTAGQVIFVREVKYTARRLEDADLEAVVDAWVARLTSSERGRPSSGTVRRDQVRRAIYRPATLPPVGDILIGSDDSIWLRRVDSRSGNTASWIRFDATGRSIGEVEAPVEAQLMRASATHVWAVVRDTDGVPAVVRYRVQ